MKRRRQANSTSSDDSEPEPEPPDPPERDPEPLTPPTAPKPLELECPQFDLYRDVATVFKQWRRPPLPDLDPTVDKILFQQLEADQEIATIPKEFARGHYATEGKMPVVRFYGQTDGGNSILLRAYGFSPYFYIKLPDDFRDVEALPIKHSLIRQLKKEEKKKEKTNYVLSVTIVTRKSILFYAFGRSYKFLRIVCALPNHVNQSRKICENGLLIPRHGIYKFDTFEGNTNYTMRFMIDRSIVGISYLTIPPNTWRARPWNTRDNQGADICLDITSHVQLEVDVWFADIVAHEPEGEYLGVVPFRMLSFDIECSGRVGIFPEPAVDPVIQIANHVVLQGTNEVICNNIFTLNTCNPISGAQVFSYETERDLLLGWRNFVIAIDPDLITGYNVANFDWPFLFDRASALGLKQFSFMGRLKTVQTKVTSKIFSSKQTGSRESKEVNIDGRLLFDCMQVVVRDYKLASYSLNSVAAKFIGDQKEDVHHSQITPLQNGNADTRRILAVYCLKDAALPQQILRKIMSIINGVEMARVTGVPFSYLLTRGQQVKVMSQIHRKVLPMGLVIPSARKTADGEKFEGATVIKPKKGYYQVHATAFENCRLQWI